MHICRRLIQTQGVGTSIKSFTLSENICISALASDPHYLISMNFNTVSLHLK